MPVIGWLGSETRKAEDSRIVPFFREGLKEGGYSEGQNVTIEYRFADGHYDRLPALAADLIHRQVSVIALTGQPSALAAKAATATIPIVFQIADDPVQLGLVASLGRPGRNITGVTSLNVEVLPKQLELLHELVPNATAIALLVNPASSARAESNARQAQVAARRLGLKLHVLHASSEPEFDAAFANAVQLRSEALVIGTDALFFGRSAQLATLAARHAIPAISPYREFAASGGLMSYGTNNTNQFRTSPGGVPPKSEGNGLHRGPKRRDRIPLGGRPLRSASRIGGRPRGPPCGAHRGARWRSSGIGGQIGDCDDTRRVHQQQ